MIRACIFFIISAIAFGLNATVIPTIFGEVDEQNPAILQLVNSKAMQRLKQIDQSGPEAYFTANYFRFSRYDHSIGVYALLKMHHASTEEQIAGLLHDTSHTVFSHLGDIIFQHGEQRNESYQDNIHDWFLTEMNIDKIIRPYNLSINDISPKNPKFTALEQPYPDMNADRIEYNLHTALATKDLNAAEVSTILKSLHFSDNKWYFDDIRTAEKFAKLSTRYTKIFWGSTHNVALYTATSAAIKYALQHQIITKDEMHFGVDQQIVDKLSSSSDPKLKQLMTIVNNIDAYYSASSHKDFDVSQYIKMRGIDPLVMQHGSLHRLSELSEDFKAELQLTSQYVKKGIFLKFVNVKDSHILDLIKNANV
jgi:HD superfamily phosphohydrolase